MGLEYCNVVLIAVLGGGEFDRAAKRLVCIAKPLPQSQLNFLKILRY